MLHTKMHRLCQPEAVLAPPADRASFWKKTVRRNMGKYLQKKAILTVFGPFRTKCPKSAFFKI